MRRLLCLCFSPIRSAFRVRRRKFPADINFTFLRWFYEWSEEKCGSKDFRDVDLLSQELEESISQFMSNVHRSLNDMSVSYLRYN